MKCKTAPNFRGGFFVGEISSLSGRAEEVGAKCKFEVSIVTLSKNKNGIYLPQSASLTAPSSEGAFILSARSVTVRRCILVYSLCMQWYCKTMGNKPRNASRTGEDPAVTGRRRWI